MAVKGIFYVAAHVTDLARSKQFYAEKLGWTLGTDEPAAAGFSFGSGYLVLLAEHRPEANPRYAGGMHVEVMVDDVDAEHARLKSLGVEVSELNTQSWGERNFTFADPDGYMWAYGQSMRGDA